MKLQIGKLDADIEEILAILPDQGLDRLKITDAHLVALAALQLHHCDPFDHLLMAQGIAEGAHFVSQDRNVALYGFRSSRARILSPCDFCGFASGDEAGPDRLGGSLA